MSLSKLSKLPPEVLSSVLNNQAIPLSHRLRLRLLSNRWADIIEEGLKKESSLVVRDKKSGYSCIQKPDDLIIKSSEPKDEFTRPLSRLFTSLTQLSIYFEEGASWNAIPSLLTHLDTSNLTAVKLYGFMLAYEQIEHIAIARALTTLSRLTSLTLDGYRLSRLLPHLKPVLSRLEAFGCFDQSDNSAGIISSSLSPQCTHLCLHSGDFKSPASSFLVELSRNLTHLHLLKCDKTIWQFLSPMHGLSSLALEFTGLTKDPYHFSELAPFSRLTQLKLYGPVYDNPLVWILTQGTPLSTIKCLTLQMDFGSYWADYHYFFETISAFFPSLAHLTILTWPNTSPAIRANIGKLSFSVEILYLCSVSNVVNWAQDL